MKHAAVLTILFIFTVCAAAQTVKGRWTGTLDTGAGTLKIVFNIMQTDGKPVCTMDSPEQRAFKIKAGITRTYETLAKTEIPVNRFNI